jgi:four helix bundle protein
MKNGKNGFLPRRGDYRTPLSFQKAEIVYDITFRFAHKFLAKGDRTIDQMIQSARSGKKNILEGSKAGTTSKETEIKLTNVARASLEELLDDYIDYLRARDLRCGTRIRKRLDTCELWPAKRRRPTSTTVSLWKPGRLK